MPTNFYDKTVIADASCLLVFTHIGRFPLLQVLCPQLITTPEVAMEYRANLPPWIQVVNVQNVAVTKSINAVLGLGESSAIALALETQNPLIILDDKRARAYAKNLGLNHTGVIGLLRLGYKKGIIKDIDVLLTELKTGCFYLPNNIEELIKE
jgi:predicted nucleic acid-binding protein